MDLDLEHLAAAVLELSPAERAELAARLLASLDEDELERRAYDTAWEADLDRRDQAVDLEPTAGLNGAAALAEVRSDLARRRAARQ